MLEALLDEVHNAALLQDLRYGFHSVVTLSTSSGKGGVALRNSPD